jgi:AdoMet-dependent heme synthase
MSYQRTVLRTWSDNVLFSALVELTYRCNLDCFFCYNDLSLAGKPMSVSDYTRLFEELVSLSCLHLTLTGGEPLSHPDFFAIAAQARELGFATRIKSNGHALRGDTARRLKEEIDPFVVEVSLHGARPETHDRQTRVPGSFARLLANLEEMKVLGLRFKINSTLTRWNESEIDGMFALAERLDAPLTVDPELTPRDDGDRTPLQIAATREGLRKLHHARTRGRLSEGDVVRQGDAELPALDSAKHCGAGSSGIAVDPFGNVYPCVQWRRAVGNLHQSSLREIWRGNGKLDEIRRLTTEVKASVNDKGKLGKFLNFCPGIAEAITGSPLEVSREAASRAELFQGLVESESESESEREVLLPIYRG